jgi:hypothetical protein
MINCQLTIMDVEPVDAAAWHDNTHDDDNSDDDNNDARYDKHAHDAVLVDVVRRAVRADGVVPAGVVAAVRMHISLITGTDMRIFAFSYATQCKSHSS